MSGGGNVVVVLDDGKSTRKLRVTKASTGESTLSSSTRITGVDLRRSILASVGEELDDSTIEVFDFSSQSFIPLEDHMDVVCRFGTRLRCSLVTTTSSNRASDGKLLAIVGRHFPYNGDEGMMVAGKRLVVKERPNIVGGGTGMNVWDGAIFLAYYLDHNPGLVEGNRVLEFGSGCGLTGIAASLLGASCVTMTDLPCSMDLTRTNLAANQDSLRGEVRCRDCDWCRPPVFDDASWDSHVVMLADCVWVEDLVAPLLKTIALFLERSELCHTVLVSYQRRGRRAHESFWGGMNELFLVERVKEGLPMVAKPENLDIFVCRALTTNTAKAI